MKISVILGHPDKDSFNHAIANTVVETLLNNRHDVIFHDLYKENFDPVTTGQEIRKGASLERVIEEHCNEISKAEGIVIVHPNWWGQPPAILKGWVDRILRPGVAYEFKEGDSGEGVPVGLLNAKTAWFSIQEIHLKKGNCRSLVILLRYSGKKMYFRLLRSRNLLQENVWSDNYQ
ncbi:NAD(P)H-dependent oxidoreductase [Methanosarcina horonobensis]|uniref:NAD(P)H-dependent oxidoreductase n=1 Tax=Methanosarcina horonobensis TaxID=418008 RepID=UPI000AC02AB8|nr:NAD(P)H-dependent oxidoreductase [Methanosarcina horonobensis]